MLQSFRNEFISFLKRSNRTIYSHNFKSKAFISNDSISKPFSSHNNSSSPKNYFFGSKFFLYGMITGSAVTTTCFYLLYENEKPKFIQNIHPNSQIEFSKIENSNEHFPAKTIQLQKLGSESSPSGKDLFRKLSEILPPNFFSQNNLNEKHFSQGENSPNSKNSKNLKKKFSNFSNLEPSEAELEGSKNFGGKKTPSDKNLVYRDTISNAVAASAPAVVNISINIRKGLVFESSGSGSIIHPDGYILTNFHVIAHAISNKKDTRFNAEITVTLHDGRTFEGQVACYDSLTDLAVLKIETKEALPSLRLGVSKTLRPGDWVLALGSPLRLSNTVTAGIVSCVERKSSELGLSGATSDYIQTDAAINVGNSGGPLVDLDGRLVGVNAMKAIAADGVSFAIPIDSAIKVIQHLAKHGRVLRPFIGIKMLQLNDAILSQIKERDPSFPHVEEGGVLVAQVIPGSPAHSAGLKAGDVIVEMDAKKITSSSQVVDLLSDKVGEKLNLKLKRSKDGFVSLQIQVEEVNNPEI